MWDIQQCFGPLIILDNGAVQLRHPTARDVLTTENGAQKEDHLWCLLDSLVQDHRNIADAYIRYLSIPSVQEDIPAAYKASSDT